MLKLFDLFDFKKIAWVRLEFQFLYISVLDSSLIILVWARKGLFFLKIITFQYYEQVKKYIKY